MKDENTRPKEHWRNNRILTIGLLLLPIAAGTFLLRFISTTRSEMDYRLKTRKVLAPTSDGEKKLLVGKAVLADVRFVPLKQVIPFPFSSYVDVQFTNSQIRLADGHTNVQFWIGPVANAIFTEEMTPGVNKIKDSKGKSLWSDASGRTRPVVIQKSVSGQILSGFGGGGGGPVGSARVTLIKFESEPGQVNIADINGKILGKRSFEILTYQKQAVVGEEEGALLLRIPKSAMKTHDVTLAKEGAVLLTYQDKSGRIFRRSKVFKGQD